VSVTNDTAYENAMWLAMVKQTILKAFHQLFFFKMIRKELLEKTEQELSKLTDQELLDEAQKLKSFSITNALIIGFLIGILVYSFAKNSWGLLSLIPLFFIYKFVNDPKNIRLKALEKLIKERGLK
jgi:uncharacterized protein YqgQ